MYKYPQREFSAHFIGASNIFSANLLNVSKCKFQIETQSDLIIAAAQRKGMRLEDITAVAANPKSKEDDGVIKDYPY